MLFDQLEADPFEQGMTKLYEHYGFKAVEEKDGTVTMKADL